MRAFMSNQRIREPFLHGASWQDFDGVRSVNLLSAEALGEARAILAVTEPADDWSGYVPLSARGRVTAGNYRQSADFEIGTAELAEALTAFVNS